MVSVLGIDATPALLDAWAGWLAPDPQPFFVEPAACRDVESDDGVITSELRDTYRLWAVDKRLRVLWLTEARFHALPREVRGRLVRAQVVCGRGAVPTVRAWQDLVDPQLLREQADGHRFVWWPSLIASNREAILERAISTRRLPSRHAEVGESTWQACAAVLPRARELAGTFPDGSTTCCFGTVVGAAGHDDRDVCGSFDPFTRWLTTACRPGGNATAPGTVMVWRSADGDPVHAAVSIGDGWALEKPSQEWHSPSGIAIVEDVVRTSRLAGQRLERHSLQ